MATIAQPRMRGDRRMWLLGIGIALLLGALAWWFWPAPGDVTRRRVIQEITLIQPPPPPPPEEEIVEKEPEIIEPVDSPEPQKDVEAPTDEPTDDKPVDPSQPSEAAGLDRPADAGSDSFRLAAGGGGGFFGRGGPGGGGGGDGGWGAYVETHVRRALRLDPRTRSAQGYLRVTLNVEPSGRISGAALRSSTGDSKLDAAVREVLSNLPPLSRPRPAAIGGATYTTIDMKRISG